jgi:hypothetical protein
MNTSFLNRCKLLISNQNRALGIGRALCVMGVAGCFFASPIATVLAGGCGQQNAAQQANNAIKKSAQQTGSSVQLVAIVKQFDAGVIDPKALNSDTLTAKTLPAGAHLDGSVELTAYNGQNLQQGDWVMIKQTQGVGNSVMYAATYFGKKSVNGQTIVELWPAETPITNGTNVKPRPVGRKLFVFLNNLTSGVTTTTQP